MIRIGRFVPLPRSRAMRFARAGSRANSLTGMCSFSRTLFTYSASWVSFPGGFVVSIRIARVKCSSVSAWIAFQLGSAAPHAAVARDRSARIPKPGKQSCKAGRKPGSKPEGLTPLERNVAMFLSRHRVDFVFQHSKRADETRARFVRLDHVVDIPAFGCHEWTREAVSILGNFRFTGSGVVVRKFPPVDDVHCPVGSHDRNL